MEEKRKELDDIAKTLSNNTNEFTAHSYNKICYNY